MTEYQYILFPTSTEFNKSFLFYLNFNQEVKILSPCRSNTSLYYKISKCADPENFHMMGMGVGSVWISLKFTKKGFRRSLTSLYIHAYPTYEIYIYITWVFSSANCNYTCNSAKWNKWAWLHFASIHLRRYQHKNEKKNNPKCNNGSFNLLQFALLRFALISSQCN